METNVMNMVEVLTFTNGENVAYLNTDGYLYKVQILGEYEDCHVCEDIIFWSITRAIAYLECRGYKVRTEAFDCYMNN